MSAKNIKCAGCGAIPQVPNGGPAWLGSTPVLECSYCSATIKLPEQPGLAEAEQINTIISQFDKIARAIKEGEKRARMTEAKRLMLRGRYAEADIALTEILTIDHTLSEAWFYRSLIPIHKHDVRLEHLDKAIEHANAQGSINRLGFFQKERDNLIRAQRRKRNRKFWVAGLYICATALSIAVATFMLLWWVL